MAAVSWAELAQTKLLACQISDDLLGGVIDHLGSKLSQLDTVDDGMIAYDFVLPDHDGEQYVGRICAKYYFNSGTCVVEDVSVDVIAT